MDPYICENDYSFPTDKYKMKLDYNVTFKKTFHNWKFWICAKENAQDHIQWTSYGDALIHLYSAHCPLLPPLDYSKAHLTLLFQYVSLKNDFLRDNHNIISHLKMNNMWVF